MTKKREKQGPAPEESDLSQKDQVEQLMEANIKLLNRVTQLEEKVEKAEVKPTPEGNAVDISDREIHELLIQTRQILPTLVGSEDLDRPKSEPHTMEVCWTVAKNIKTRENEGWKICAHQEEVVSMIPMERRLDSRRRAILERHQRNIQDVYENDGDKGGKQGVFTSDRLIGQTDIDVGYGRTGT